MKTIEEAAKAWRDAEYPKTGMNDDWADDGWDEGYNCAARESSIRDFIAGIEFAQRWISVDEELPEIDTPVLVMVSHFRSSIITVARYNSEEGEIAWKNNLFSDRIRLKVTHWRPIELK
jgi:hypothetical protein